MGTMNSAFLQALAVGLLLTINTCHAHDALAKPISAEPGMSGHVSQTVATGFLDLVSRQSSSEQDDPEYDSLYEGEGKFISGVTVGCETSKPFFCGKRCFQAKKAFKKLYYKKVPDQYICGYESPAYVPPSPPAQQVSPEMTGPPPTPPTVAPTAAPTYAQHGHGGYQSDYHVSVSVGRQQQVYNGYDQGSQPYPEHIPKYCPRYKNVPYYKVVYLPVKKCEKWYCEKTQCKRKTNSQPEEVNYGY